MWMNSLVLWIVEIFNAIVVVILHLDLKYFYLFQKLLFFQTLAVHLHVHVTRNVCNQGIHVIPNQVREFM